MNNNSLVAKWIARCDREIDEKCKRGGCPKCKYWKVCRKIAELNAKFKIRGYNK